MKRNLLLMARALAIAGAATLPWYSGQVAAQSVPDVAADAASDVDVDAAADATESSADVAADASADAAADPSTDSSVEANVDASVEGQADAPPATDADIAADADVGADASASGADVDANVDANAHANVDANGNPVDPNQPNTTDPAAAADGDAAVEGEAGVNVRGREGRVDVRQGLNFGAAVDRGLTINAIERSSLFYDNGLRRGDILTSYNGRPIRSEADFRRWVIFTPGQRIPVIVLREGRPQTIYITYRQDRNGGYDQGPVARGGAYLGVSFDPRIGDAAVVRTVTPGSPAERAGVQPGDAIVALNGNAVSSPQDVVQLVASMRPGQRLDLELSRRAQVVLGARPITAVQAAGAFEGGVAGNPNYGPGAPPTPPQPEAAVEAEVGGYTEGDVDVARPGDADGDGRVLDGDGRVTRPERGGLLQRGRR